MESRICCYTLDAWGWGWGWRRKFLSARFGGVERGKLKGGAGRANDRKKSGLLACIDGQWRLRTYLT
ncbi:hypothetical protein LZ30DRAFT_734356 [Colletotrichum cereale]|nr:hypothetical protein LZ30DRAFT_734356 [Colletotrichum cereale]